MKIKRFSVREIILSLLFFIAGYRINLSSDSDSELHVKLKEKVESKLQTSWSHPGDIQLFSIFSIFIERFVKTRAVDRMQPPLLK